MSNGAHPEVFRLEVPSDPAYLATARLFVASAFRLFGTDEERIADLKLAVSEAASAVLLRRDHPTVTVEITRLSRGDLVAIGPLLPGDLSGDDLAPADVVSALFATARIDAETKQLLILVESNRDD